MDQWLDSLSEDWPSQPPSAHNSSSILSDEDPVQNVGSQSRIPRRAASNVSSADRKELARNLSQKGDGLANWPLKEKTSSSLNASPRVSSSKNGKLPSQSPRSSLKRNYHNDNNANGHPTASSPSIPAGTVAFKASPVKDIHQTPEWKRRLVQGRVGPGDQTDMFGPMGLQNVFRPPTLAPRPSGQRKRGIDAMKSIAESHGRSSDPSLSASRSELGDHDQSSSPKQRTIGDIDEKEMLAVDVKQQEQKGQSSAIGQTSIPSPKSDCISFADSQNNSSSHANSNDFTPVHVSKSHTIDGKVNYAAIDIGLQRLHSNMEHLRISQQDHSSVQSETNDSHFSSSETPGMSFRKSQLNEITNQSLPEDLSVGTDAFAANGGFVSLHRGGYSKEGSFQKRSLSPSSSNPLDSHTGHVTRASSEALPSPQSSQRRPGRPSTPPRTPSKGNEERPRSSGSPLKLFDKYDTFTNDRLAQHISRFEQTLAQDGDMDGSSQADLGPSSPSPGPKLLKKLSPADQPAEHNLTSRVSSFGTAEFVGCDFDANSQVLVKTALSSHSWDENGLQSPSGHRRDKQASRGRRRPSRTDQNYQASSEDYQDAESVEAVDKASEPAYQTEGVLYTAHGKRLPDSPEKEVARKRRRTICSSEERKQTTSNAQATIPNRNMKEATTAASSGRKRKDARYDSERQAADPETLKTRHILRPRNPTPNQTGSVSQGLVSKESQHPRITITGYGRMTAIQHVATDPTPNMDPPTQIVAGALASIALNTVQDMTSGSRKASVTTSDFFNEAQQIMALIRAEKRPRSSHTSAETSNIAHSIIQEEPSMADSTRDNLTRPPSREGGNSGLAHTPPQQKARIVSHLRKFEDEEDLGLALPSSGKSLRINARDVSAVNSPAISTDEQPADDVESDPPNIRIRQGGINRHQEENSPSSSDQHALNGEADSGNLESRGSSSSSMDKSQPTGSSRGSANLKQIAPHTVAHLLSDQMADMFFDEDRKLWVKRKVTPHAANVDAEAHAISRQSEEDLFGDIPDLSVDEMEELNRVKEVVASRDHLSLEGRSVARPKRAVQSGAQEDEAGAREVKPAARPSTADGKVIPPADDSSAPSKYSNFAWSGPRPRTRATSYGDDVWPDKPAQQQQSHQETLPVNENEPQSPEVEREISILDSREPHSLRREGAEYCRPRVVTVAFSSPLVQSPYQPDDDWEQIDGSRLEDSPSRQALQPQRSAKKPNPSGISNGQRYASRRLSIGNSSFIARPMSRLDELDEMSLVCYSAQRPQTTTDLAISTPLPLSRSLAIQPTTGHRSSIGFSLSPLPDFSMHQIDRPLDANEGAIVQQQRPQAISNALSLTAQELVKHLTDTEPYEPYWDHLTAVDLNGRSLTSLHMLDEFCSRTQELNASRNRIRDLDGVPSSVRSLTISDNFLSELTAWHTLRNLQYLNVSGNKLRSLKGFQGLFHLRTLKADDNEIDSLDGFQCLDGLLSLSLRRNRLSIVDFDGFNL